jgi:HTH-type transcriptional regulator, sugar sensing transcriptional regulator
MIGTLGLLKQLGLNEKEARLYLTALELGPSTILTLAKKSGVKRTSIYNFLNEMVERGFIIYTISGKKTLYSAIEPEGLVKIIERQKQLIESAMPELNLLSQKGGGVKPKIKFYEGIEGIKQVYEDTLNQPDESSFVAFTPVVSAYDVLPNAFIENYIYRRAKIKKISVKVILREDEKSREYVKKNKEQLRETLTVPGSLLAIENEINIYQNKVAITSFGDEKIGIIIESKQIADAQRAIFNTLWEALKLLNKNKIKLK